jgi:hypothetical protein
LDKWDDVANGSADEFAAQNGIEVEIGTRGTDPEHLLNYLRIAKRMDARLIRTMGGWHGAPASLEEIEANLRKVLPDYEDAGTKIALEITRHTEPRTWQH